MGYWIKKKKRNRDSSRKTRESGISMVRSGFSRPGLEYLPCERWLETLRAQPPVVQTGVFHRSLTPSFVTLWKLVPPRSSLCEASSYSFASSSSSYSSCSDSSFTFYSPNHFCLLVCFALTSFYCHCLFSHLVKGSSSLSPSCISFNSYSVPFLKFSHFWLHCFLLLCWSRLSYRCYSSWSSLRMSRRLRVKNRNSRASLSDVGP